MGTAVDTRHGDGEVSFLNPFGIARLGTIEILGGGCSESEGHRLDVVASISAELCFQN